MLTVLFMKSMQQWFDEYAESHQNITNQKIHFICVPVIYFSIVGMLMSIPSKIIGNLLQFENQFITNWAAVIILFVLLFYLIHSFKSFVSMFIFSAVCVIFNSYLSLYLPLFLTSLILFIVAWIGQFYGHKLEGKKPSFFKDLQFLLIGPAWVFEKIKK